MGNNDQNQNLCGNNWTPICSRCQLEVKECCRDVELTLFPDELEPFLERDPHNVSEYTNETFGYDKEGACCFLTDQFECELQLMGIPKPIDCLIYPLNYKNGKIYLDLSCWAKELLNKPEAIDLLQTKLKKYPQYATVDYELRDTDEFVMDLPVG